MQRKTKENLAKKISVDEVYDNGDGIVIITDPEKDLIRLAHLYENNITNENIVSDFKRLKKSGGDIDYGVRDAANCIKTLFLRSFQPIKLQLCLFHLIKNVLKHFLKWHRAIRDEVKQLPCGLQTKGTKLKKYLFQKRHLFVKKQLNQEEAKILKNITAAIPTFGRLRRLYLMFMAIFDSKNKQQAQFNFYNFIAELEVTQHLTQLEKQLLKYYHNQELFTYLGYDKTIWTKIRTSNHTERINRTFRKKQKTHYRIKKTKGRMELLRCMIYFHNSKSLNRRQSTSTCC